MTVCEDQTLRIVRAHGPIMPIDVARRLWPASKGWGRPLGRGEQGLARAAARILHRLKDQGLVDTVVINIGRSCRRVHWRTR